MFSLISCQEHCQRFSPLWIFDILQAGYEPTQNVISGFAEWICAVVINTTPRRYKRLYVLGLISIDFILIVLWYISWYLLTISSNLSIYIFYNINIYIMQSYCSSWSHSSFMSCCQFLFIQFWISNVSTLILSHFTLILYQTK